MSSYKEIDIDNWNRKQHYEHFKQMLDPTFAIVAPVDVSKAYQYAKDNNISFFTKYLYACMTAINTVENLKYRILDDKVVCYDVIHASATMLRPDKTFGCSFVHYSEDIQEFFKNINNEKERINSSSDLFPPINGIDCIYCSSMPWVNFYGHKEPASGQHNSVPQLAFSKFENQQDKMMMNVAVNVNHALVDGYHLGLFFENFEKSLDN